MAQRNAGVPQVIDPDVVATMIRDLQIEGRVGVLNVSDVLVPTYLVAQGQTLDFTTLAPFYTAGELFSAGIQVSPPANSVLADTGAVAAGVFDLIVDAGSNAAVDFLVQHRDAANATNVNQWIIGANPSGGARWTMSMQLALSERIRVLNNGVGGTATQATVAARLRT